MAPPECHDRLLGRCRGDRAGGSNHRRAAARPGYAGETRCSGGNRPAILPVHRRAGTLARPGADGEDRQPCAGRSDRAHQVGHRLCHPGGRRAEPAARRVLRPCPPVIGPVRSAREDDLELLGQFGRPAFAYSGAQPQLLPVVQRARIIDLYDGRVRGYFRDHSRVAPHNLYARSSAAARPAAGASRARDIGFRFGPAPPGGHQVTSLPVSYPAASFAFRWSAVPGAGWCGWTGSRLEPPRRPAVAATVVIQYTRVRTSRFLEAGTRPPYAESTGTGTGLVLPRWPGLLNPLVTAGGRQRHRVHHLVRPADDVRPRPGLGRARRRTVTGVPDHVSVPDQPEEHELR